MIENKFLQVNIYALPKEGANISSAVRLSYPGDIHAFDETPITILNPADVGDIMQRAEYVGANIGSSFSSDRPYAPDRTLYAWALSPSASSDLVVIPYSLEDMNHSEELTNLAQQIKANEPIATQQREVTVVLR
jgi:hypothetical protein